MLMLHGPHGLGVVPARPSSNRDVPGSLNRLSVRSKHGTARTSDQPGPVFYRAGPCSHRAKSYGPHVSPFNAGHYYYPVPVQLSFPTTNLNWPHAKLLDRNFNKNKMEGICGSIKSKWHASNRFQNWVMVSNPFSPTSDLLQSYHDLCQHPTTLFFTWINVRI
jgi:hypothetical protein